MLVALALLIAHFKQGQCLFVAGHQYVAHVAGQSLDKQAGIESFVDDAIEQYHDVGHLIVNRKVDYLEIVFCIKHVKVFNNFLVGDVSLTERGRLVENGQSVAHTAVGFLGNDGQCLLFILYSLAFSH